MVQTIHLCVLHVPAPDNCSKKEIFNISSPSMTAAKLGIAKSTLYQKIKEYGLAQEVANARAETPEIARVP